MDRSRPAAGGGLPAGTNGQTLYSNGSGWLASSLLTNDGASNVGVNGDLNLPNTTATSSGVINFGGTPFIHNYASVGSEGHNTFVGQGAGNFTLTWSSDTDEGSYNTALGDLSLSSDTTGEGNTAIGHKSLTANTTGIFNTALGNTSLASNTTGSVNTALGTWSLNSNTTGKDNTASGAGSLAYNTTGIDNTAVGFWALGSNTTGGANTAFGSWSLNSNATEWVIPPSAPRATGASWG